jgi:hypothetical protein
MSIVPIGKYSVRPPSHRRIIILLCVRVHLFRIIITAIRVIYAEREIYIYILNSVYDRREVHAAIKTGRIKTKNNCKENILHSKRVNSIFIYIYENIYIYM